MRKIIFILLWVGFSYLNLAHSQTINLHLPDKEVQQGDVVRIEITANGFDEIASMQFSINWNPAVIEYLSYELTDLANVAIGDTDASEGSLRFSWFDAAGIGLSIPNESSIIAFNFMAVGNVGDFTEINITDNPLSIQIFKAGSTPGLFDPVNLEQEDGSVSIIAAGVVTYQVEPITCFDAMDGEINLNVPAGDFTYNWTGPDDFMAQTEDISQLAAGDYQLTVTDNMGETVFEGTISVIQPSALFVQNTETTPANCMQDIGSANITLNGGSSPYVFDIGSANNTDGLFTNLAADNYYLTVTDANNCTLLDTFTIIASNAPSVDLGSDKIICEGETLTLSAGQYLNYQWSTGSQINSITVSESGIYSVTVSNDPNCPGMDEVEITVQSPPQILIENDLLNICPGDTLQLQISGGDSYQWTDETMTLSQLDIANPLAFPENTSTYSVFSENMCGEDTVAVEVVVVELNAAAGADTCIILDTEVRLTASGGVDYFWHINEYPVSNDEIYDPIAFPKDSATYFVTIIDANGCETIDSMTVLVASDPISAIKKINMITPNGDGKNDFLLFKGLHKFGSNTLKIYNRWGAIIYQKVNYHHDDEYFDGTYNGKILPAGSYYYVLSFPAGEIKQRLTIVRE